MWTMKILHALLSMLLTLGIIAGESQQWRPIPSMLAISFSRDPRQYLFSDTTLQQNFLARFMFIFCFPCPRHVFRSSGSTGEDNININDTGDDLVSLMGFDTLWWAMASI